MSLLYFHVCFIWQAEGKKKNKCQDKKIISWQLFSVIYYKQLDSLSIPSIPYLYLSLTACSIT